MRVSADLGASLRVLERWMLPAECLLCRRPADAVEPDALVCRFCRVRWRRLAPPVCERCGQPVRLGLPCRICPEWPPALARTRSAVWLDGTAREVVHRLKYDGWWRVTEAMADAMRGLEPLTPPLFLIPVPLASRRLRGRGYNQSARLAAALGRRLGCPVRGDALTRTLETRTQTALTPEARRANVAGVFRAHRVDEGGTAVLVDDVFTTGATLGAAAAALAEVGIARVEAATFARALPPVG